MDVINTYIQIIHGIINIEDTEKIDIILKEFKSKMNEYTLTVKEATREYHRRYHKTEKGKDKLKEAKRRWYLKNRDRICKKRREQYASWKE